MPEFDEKSAARIKSAVQWVESQRNSREQETQPVEFSIYRFVLREDFAGRTEALAQAVLPELGDVVMDAVYLVDEEGVLSAARAGYTGYAFWFNGKLFPLWGRCIQRCEHSATLSVGDPPEGTVDSPYSHSVSAVDINSGSISGNFPVESGLSIDSSGNISGVPAEPGEFVGVITGEAASNTGAGTCTLTRAITIVIRE